MVGVPGKSKACHTCRKRRKGCDKQRPACGPCLRNGFTCEGYDRRRIFINNNSETTRNAAYSAPVRIQHRRASPSALPASRDSLNRVAYESQYVDAFWRAYLPYGRVVSPLAAQYSTAGWTTIAQRLYSDHDLLKLALGAFSFCAAGHQSSDVWMLVKGRDLYGMALQKMAQSLRGPGRGGDHDNVIIIASRILTLFEVFFETNPDDKASQYKIWFNHSAGEAALFLRRDPAAYATGDAHHLLEDGRLHMATLDMMNRKRSFLSSHEWKTMPWRGLDKTPKDRLLDILVEIPELLEGLDELYSLGDDAQTLSALRQTFLEKLIGFERQLQKWYDNTFHSTPWICGNTVLLRNEIGLAAVHLMAVYWTARLVLFNTRRLPLFPCNDALDLVTAEALKQRIMPLIARLTETHSGWFGRHSAVLPGGATNCLLKSISDEAERDLEVDRLIQLFGDMKSTAISPTFLECKK